MNLAQGVLRFLAKLKSDPTTATNAAMVNALGREAMCWRGNSAAALYAPIAPETWNVRATLANTDEQTGPIPVRFGRPVEIVAMNPTVKPVLPLAGGGLVIPTIDDLLVQIVIENERNITQGDGGQTKINAQLFCTLSDFSVQIPRLVMRRLRTGDPSVSWNFRWRQPPPGLGPIYEAADIRVGVFTRYLSAEEITAEYQDSQALGL